MLVEQIAGYPIWHVNFPDQYTLAMTFLRMQEHYESPRFRGKVFMLEEFMDWYAKDRGKFSYAEDWSGFNVPSSAVRNVLSHFPEHSQKEKRLFRVLNRIGIFRRARFYLIGTYGKDRGALDHEIRHGMFYHDAEYRRVVTAIVKKYSVKKFQKQLLSMGYDRSVLIDEIQAYALDGPSKKHPDTKEMRNLRKELKEAVLKRWPINR